MPTAHIVVETELSRSTRVQQLEAMFDVPAQEKSRLEWDVNIPIEDDDWNVGLIVGPSGSGKTTILNNCFKRPQDLTWDSLSLIDDFSKDHTMEEIAKVCQAVGFNTIPAWMRPFSVLSNGEQFRATLARKLLEDESPIVMDEFTSVVDRQVAKIGSHAVQKYVRKNDKQFVASSCHYDIVDWLQPDWIYEPGTLKFSRRRLRQRPKLDITISFVPHSAWQLFSKFHYLTNTLHKSARCFCLFVNGEPASIVCNLWRVHPRVKDIVGASRGVTLPDWQGLGLAMILLNYLGAAHAAIGKRYRTYPAHPAFIRAHVRSKEWRQVKRGGDFSPRRGESSTVESTPRPCAVFEWDGDRELLTKEQAERLLVERAK